MRAPRSSFFLDAETQTQVPVFAWQAHYKIKASPHPFTQAFNGGN